MRVTLAELATFRVAVKFRTGDSVVIKVYDATNASEPALSSPACTEIGATGVFYWSFSNLSVQPTAPTAYLWTMCSNNSGDYTGPMLYAGGWNDAISSGLSAVKAQTDKMVFVGSDIKATLDGEEVAANVVKVSGDAIAADNLEAQFDGTGLTGDAFPGRQDQIAGLSIGSAAISTVASGFVLTTGTQTGSYTNTFNKNGDYHLLRDSGGNLDCYYEFNVGADGVPVDIVFWGRVTPKGRNVGVYGYDWVANNWQQIEIWAGDNTTTDSTKIGKLRTTMVGSGSNAGKVRVRLAGSGISGVYVYNDYMYLSYSVVYRSVGYADGAVWVKATGSSGTTVYINGTADNPCPWSDALTIAAALGIARFRILNGETITLSSSLGSKTLIGKQWNLNLNGQSINACYVEGATVSGVGSALATPMFVDCKIGAATLPPSILLRTGIGHGSGTLTGGTAGSYEFVDCFSLVGHGGTPTLNFAGLGADTHIQMRRWTAGTAMTLDANCSCKIDSMGGGRHVVDVGGGELSLRGTSKGASITLAAGGKADVSGIFGTIEVAGSGGTLSLLGGVTGMVIDNSGGAVAIDSSELNLANINAEMDAALADYSDDLADAVWDEDVAGHVIPGSTGNTLSGISSGVSSVYANTQRVDGLIGIDSSGNDRFTAKALELAPTGGGGGASPSDVWGYVPSGLEPSGSAAQLLASAASGGASSVVVKPVSGSVVVALDLSGAFAQAGGTSWSVRMVRVLDKDKNDVTYSLLTGCTVANGVFTCHINSGGRLDAAPYEIIAAVRVGVNPARWVARSCLMHLEAR